VDETGAVVPGATVVVQSACGGAPINVETDWQGAFQINGLRPGGLELRVEVEGFRAYRAVGLRVDPNGTLPVRVSLEVGDVSETLNVMAEPSVVSTVSASRAELVEQEEAEEADEAVEGGVVGGVLGGVAGGVVGGLDAVPPPAPPPPMTPALVASPAAAKAKRDGGGGEPAEASITIQAWDPATPYLAKMKEAGEAHAYATYLEERPHYADSPAFYLDCADHLLKIDQRELGLRVLTNVVEMKLEDARLIRIAAHRLQQIGELDLAIELFERVLHLRPEEPQSPRDLALALAARVDAHRAAQADPVKVAEDALRALDLLNDVVVGAWDGRFPEIEVVALMDANRLLAIMEREHLPGIEQVKLDPRLRKLLDVDMRIVMTWDTDLTDMDLWVTEPTGEKCFYSHALTAIGGMISKDFTQGYGPEEYLVRRALAGDYRIQANFYGSRAQQLTGPTTVQATVITRFGRPDEKRQALTLRLGEAKEVVNIGEVQFE
jgi:Ca-activated chloride channel family protein